MHRAATNLAASLGEISKLNQHTDTPRMHCANRFVHSAPRHTNKCAARTRTTDSAGRRTPGRAACAHISRTNGCIVYVIQYIKHELCNIKLRYLLCAQYHIILHILLVVRRCDDWAAAAL